MDWLYMYMPISGIDIFWPGLLLIGFSVGVIGGFFGMGGAWMVTPGLNILGFPMAFAIGTDIAHMAGKSMISTFRHSKFGNVDYKLGLIMVIGTVIGIECGAQLVMYLEGIGKVGPVVRWVYVGVLFLIALMVFTDYRKAVQKKKSGIVGDRGAEGFTWYKTLQRINIPPMMRFEVAGITCFCMAAHVRKSFHRRSGRLSRHRRRPAPNAGSSLSHRMPDPYSCRNRSI